MKLCHFGDCMSSVDPDCIKTPEDTDNYRQDRCDGRERRKSCCRDRNTDPGRNEVKLAKCREVEYEIHDRSDQGKFVNSSVHEIEEGEEIKNGQEFENPVS